MNKKKRLSLSDWTVKLLSEEQLTFTIDEAMRSLGMGRESFLAAAERLQKKQYLIKLRSGFYVIVPPEFLGYEAPMPEMYIDDLMRYENCLYYVALRKAAEYHGAAHQGVMQYQVMTNKVLRSVVAGGNYIVFYKRKNFEAIEHGLEDRVMKNGRRVKISSPELTAFEILRYPRSIGMVDSMATVLAELGEVLGPEKLAVLAPAFERSIVQRLGYMLDWFNFETLADSLQCFLGQQENSWVELDPYLARCKEFAPQPIERNRKWKVIVRRELDPDVYPEF